MWLTILVFVLHFLYIGLKCQLTALCYVYVYIFSFLYHNLSISENLCINDVGL